MFMKYNENILTKGIITTQINKYALSFDIYQDVILCNNMVLRRKVIEN